MTVVYIDGVEWGQQHPDINSRPITFSRLNTRLPLSKLNRLIWVGPVLNLRTHESAAAFYRLKLHTWEDMSIKLCTFVSSSSSSCLLLTKVRLPTRRASAELRRKSIIQQSIFPWDGPPPPSGQFFHSHCTNCPFSNYMHASN
jgi:hypothetical protein